MYEDREKTGVWGFIVKRSVLLRRPRTREQSKERPEERMKTGRETGESHSFESCLTMKNLFCTKIIVTNFICLFFVTFAAYAQPQTGNYSIGLVL